MKIKSGYLLACAGLALAGSVWFGASAVQRGDAAALPAANVVPVAMEERGDGEFHPARACVRSFSKDICESWTEHGDLSVGNCPEIGCRTAYTKGMPWTINLRHNEQSCSTGDTRGRCDESRRKDGRVETYISTTLRVDDPCQLRGVFEGRWELQAEDGNYYKGRVFGTLGVGTHRRFVCPAYMERDCENCHDVEFLPEAGLWRIGVEAQFVGNPMHIDGNQEVIRFSLSGDFYAPGDENGLFGDTYSGGWRFVGTADGAHIIYCP